MGEPGEHGQLDVVTSMPRIDDDGKVSLRITQNGANAVIEIEDDGVAFIGDLEEAAPGVVEGEAELTVAGETRLTQAGDVYTIPGDVVHGVTAGDQPVKLVEVFYPTREEFR